MTDTTQGCRSIWRRLMHCCLLLAPLTVWAQLQNSVNVAYLQGKTPVAPDAIGHLGPDLFGDQINLYNGSFSFEQTDVELPGNTALPVALVRSHEPGRQSITRGALGDWDLNTPRIQGSFADPEGWIPHYGSPGNRCSAFNFPPYVARGGFTPEDFSPDEYWSGTSLVVPGQGSQEILKNSALPHAGSNWPLATRNLWKIGCLSSVQNAPGQGFIARSPDGVTYRFDWMASRVIPQLRKASVGLERREMFLMATLVTDRFGNTVSYEYSAANPMLLTRISSSDGRVISIAYRNGRVYTVNDGTRTWTYTYDINGDLRHVVLPDDSRWTFSLRSLVVPQGTIVDDGGSADCDSLPSVNGYATSGSMTHPSGASAVFHTNFITQGRSNVQRLCTYHSGELGNYTNGAVHPKSTVNQALVKKVITGPGMSAMQWQYINGADPWGAWAPCTDCPDRKIVRVIEPSGATTRHTFGTRWRENEGQLLRLEEGVTGSTVLRSTDYRYRTPGGQDFADGFGESVRFTTDWVSTRNRPEDRRHIVQQGKTFTREVLAAPGSFGAYAHPQVTRLSSSLGHSKTELRTYRHFTELWVLGQTGSVKTRLLDTGSETPVEEESHDFEDASGLVSRTRVFGRLDRSMTYHAEGMLKTLSDGAGETTTFSEYHRGQPQKAVFADGTTANQVINNLGKATSFTNEANAKVELQHDSMGRVAQITYPAGCVTTQRFEQSAASDRGLDIGHWRQTVDTCGGRTVRWFDALWRVRLEQQLDAVNEDATSSWVETRFDAAGRQLYRSYPVRSLAGVDTLDSDPTAMLQPQAGISFQYDGLNRLTMQRAASELGVLSTTTDYIADFVKRVTSPRGHVTSYRYQAYDQPNEDLIKEIRAPEGVKLVIARDRFGKALSITRSGPSGVDDTSVSATRSYIYDQHQRLCKMVEPETGVTLQGYDAANNLRWRSGGKSASTACRSGLLSNDGQQIEFRYDARNRLRWVLHNDGQPTIERQYTNDGLLQRVTSGNFTWDYTYNTRRLLTREALSFGSLSPGTKWNFTRTINDRHHVSELADPAGTVSYAPDALGRPTQVSGFASEVSYHPNGSLAGYKLANGIRHSVTQNKRGLPERWRDVGVLDETYSYDGNGNVVAITDATPGGKSRSMPIYDGLDRLREATGAWGTASYTYDALDNLRRSQVGGRTLTHLYAIGNRLTGLSGSQTLSISYDVQGNVYQRGSRSFGFDSANRMRWSSGAVDVYDYDGHGRRSYVKWSNGSQQLNAYGMADASGATGRLLYSHHTNRGSTRYVYLGNQLLAEHNSLTGRRYSHTDALGSPVAWSNASTTPVVTAKTRYEPYGATQSGPQPNTIGFAGHVNDPETGLVYMQQRYYDPIAGRFLSVDPVTTDAGNGALFNRYMYAANNPYSRIDPDGRRDIYIGGASDKDSTRIVQDYAAGQQRLNPGRDVQYFSYSEKREIAAAINAPLKDGEPLNVIGHSLGGREAINQANSTGAMITNLVSIDPVGSAGNGNKPASVGTWTDVTAVPSNRNSSDTVASAGRFFLGTTKTSGADSAQNVSTSHGNFSTMMSKSGSQQKIDDSYQRPKDTQ